MAKLIKIYNCDPGRGSPVNVIGGAEHIKIVLVDDPDSDDEELVYQGDKFDIAELVKIWKERHSDSRLPRGLKRFTG